MSTEEIMFYSNCFSPHHPVASLPNRMVVQLKDTLTFLSVSQDAESKTLTRTDESLFR